MIDYYNQTEKQVKLEEVPVKQVITFVSENPEIEGLFLVKSINEYAIYINNQKVTSDIKKALIIRNHIEFHSKDLIGRLWTKTSLLKPYLRVKEDEKCFTLRENKRIFDFLVNTVLRFKPEERKLENEKKMVLNNAYFDKTDKSAFFTEHLLSIYSRKYRKRYEKRKNRFETLLEEDKSEAALNLLASQFITESAEIRDAVEFGYYLHLNREENDRTRKRITVKQYSAFMKDFYDTFIIESDIGERKIEKHC